MSRPVSLGILAVSLALILVAAVALLMRDGNGSSASDRDNDDATSVPRDRGNPATPEGKTPAAVIATPTSVAGALTPTGSASGPAGHEGERALAHVQELAKEPRVSGTPAEARAAQYIAAQFASYGYSTEIIEFEFDGDRFRAGEVEVAGRRSEALTLAGSPGGLVSANTVYVGLADNAGIGGRDLRGKIAVADRGTLNFVVKYQNVKDAGAVGLVIVNNQPGPFSGNLTTLAEFPVAAVSQEDGAAVLAAAKDGDRIAIDLPGTTGLTKALNILAKPSAAATCEVLVGGHFDSVPGAPGANDNASGAANVLELARATAADGLDDGLCFATFGAEESGLYGSKAMVAAMDEAGELPQFMLNLDVTGIGKGVEVIGGSQAAREALATASTAGIPAVASTLPANSGSDHESFVNAGVEVVFLTSGDFSTIHSPQDVSSAINETVLDQVGDLGLLVIKSLLAQVARG